MPRPLVPAEEERVRASVRRDRPFGQDIRGMSPWSVSGRLAAGAKSWRPRLLPGTSAQGIDRKTPHPIFCIPPVIAHQTASARKNGDQGWQSESESLNLKLRLRRARDSTYLVPQIQRATDCQSVPQLLEPAYVPVRRSPWYGRISRREAWCRHRRQSKGQSQARLTRPPYGPGPGRRSARPRSPARC